MIRTVPARTPAPLGYALLGLLHQAPMSGYDLRKIFAETALGNYSSSPGAIYPALRRLEEQGLIEGDVDATTALRPRKIFRPTAAGTRTLRTWLARDIGREDVERRLDELMLRFAFHSILDSRAATRRFLESFRREVEDYLEELERQRKVFPEGAPPHPRLALEAGIQQYRACARWSREARAHFKENDS